MKAEDILHRYAKGETDFRGTDLRCQSFKGENLTGADFSNAHIQSANFEGATLKGTKFISAKAGLTGFRSKLILFLSWIFLVIPGVLAVCNSAYLLGLLLYYVKPEFKIIPIILLFFGGLVMINKFINHKINFLQNANFQFLILSILGGATLLSVIVRALFSSNSNSLIETLALAWYLAWYANISLMIAGAITGAIPQFKATARTVTIILAVGLSIVGTAWKTVNLSEDLGSSPMAIASIMTVAFVYSGWNFIKKPEHPNYHDDWLRRTTTWITTFGGTSFRGSDLTEADFSGASLENTDLYTFAYLRANFHHAKNLFISKLPDKFDIFYPELLNLAVKHEWHEKLNASTTMEYGLPKILPGVIQGINLKGATLTSCSRDYLKNVIFCDCDLRNVNLSELDLRQTTFQDCLLNGIILTNTNMIELNIKGFDLSDADLSGANLTRVDALGTNFSRANLTGACIEDWHINHETKLDQVKCDFINLRSNQRFPDARSFQDQEFEKRFSIANNELKILIPDTVDLEAFRYALHKLKEDNKIGDSIGISQIKDTFVLNFKDPGCLNETGMQRIWNTAYEDALNKTGRFVHFKRLHSVPIRVKGFDEIHTVVNNYYGGDVVNNSGNNTNVVGSGNNTNHSGDVSEGAQVNQDADSSTNQSLNQNKVVLNQAIQDLIATIDTHQSQVGDYKGAIEAVKQINEEANKEKPNKFTLQGALDAVKSSVGSIVEILEKVDLLRKAITLTGFLLP